ncbi:MAG: HAD-IC family P-type ATPase [Clostridia bacterium]
MCFCIFIIGITKKISFLEMFMTSVGLAVAAIPEGLPAIVTILLSIGVTKMAKKNAIIRKLPAVETLGSSSVICSDKTGTLTQNKMEVVKLVSINGNLVIKSTQETSRFILELGAMCNDANISYENKKKLNGEPTELAILAAAIKIGEDKSKLYTNFPRVSEIPFNSTRKLMTTIHKVGNKYRVITKGAPDTLIKKCSMCYNSGIIENMTFSKEETLNKLNEDMANESLRIIGISYKDIDKLPTSIENNDIEKNLVFVGLIGMIDPPRPGTKKAVATCNKASIKTVMITGDHILTAKAIARNIGILKERRPCNNRLRT